MEYKDIVIDNDALVNTEPRELETEPQWKPQGEKPQLNPNPGYGENINRKFINAVIKANLNDSESQKLYFYAKVRTEGTIVNETFYFAYIMEDTEDEIFNCLEHGGTHLIFHYTDGDLPELLNENDNPVTIESFSLDYDRTDPEFIPLFKDVGIHTKPALVTNLVEGEHVQPSNEFEKPEGAKVVKERTNFVGGLYVDGVSVVDALNSIDAKQNKLYKHLVTFNVNGGGNCYGVFYSHIKNGVQAFTALSTGETIASSVQKGEGTQGTNPYFAVYTGIRKGSGNQAIVYGVKVTHYQDFRVSGSNIQIVTNRFESANTSATATAGSITTIEL